MRHRGALVLLAGWLLMYPPLTKQADGTYSMQSAAPVARWVQDSAYDTVGKCESIRDSMAAAALRDLGPDDGQPPTSERSWEWRTAIRRAFAVSRCVPAEHIYPPRTPAD